MSFTDDVNDLIETELYSWTFHPSEDLEYSANLYFKHTPSEDRPDGQPLPFEDLQRLHDEYTIISVQSNSDGRTGSQLCVRIADP